MQACAVALVEATYNMALGMAKASATRKVGGEFAPESSEWFTAATGGVVKRPRGPAPP